MQEIQAHGYAVVYARQEGRGIGLAKKLHAYELQEQGLMQLSQIKSWVWSRPA